MLIASAFFNELEEALRNRKNFYPMFRIAPHTISMGWDNRHVKAVGETLGVTIVKSEAWVDEKDYDATIVSWHPFVDPETTINNVIDSMINALLLHQKR